MKGSDNTCSGCIISITHRLTGINDIAITTIITIMVIITMNITMVIIATITIINVITIINILAVSQACLSYGTQGSMSLEQAHRTTHWEIIRVAVKELKLSYHTMSIY